MPSTTAPIRGRERKVRNQPARYDLCPQGQGRRRVGGGVQLPSDKNARAGR